MKPTLLILLIIFSSCDSGPSYPMKVFYIDCYNNGLAQYGLRGANGMVISYIDSCNRYSIGDTIK